MDIYASTNDLKKVSHSPVLSGLININLTDTRILFAYVHQYYKYSN